MAQFEPSEAPGFGVSIGRTVWELVLRLKPLGVGIARTGHRHKAPGLVPRSQGRACSAPGGRDLARPPRLVHWRRNYFPGDRILITAALQRSLEDEYDVLSQNVSDMTAQLRRNFPFYSPRYLAHMLSDTMLPAVIGYFATMLYNPNNVTTEAAPVTVEWEIEACNQVLAMLGYKVPPEPGEVGREDFGWAHLTLGGTTANVEALWIARTVRYFPLAVRQVAIDLSLELEVRLPSQVKGGPAVVRDIRELSDWDVLMLRPNEAIFLLSKYVQSIASKFELGPDEAGHQAWDLANRTPFGPGQGVAKVFDLYPPVIFASGAAHYSIGKAADILGIGRGNVVSVAVDEHFRIDVADLERQIRNELSKERKRVPLAVVGIAGTTEEGAVDPIDQIHDLRQRLEREQPPTTFWFHVDAAWGGFMRSLFRDEDAKLGKIAGRLGVAYTGDLRRFHKDLFDRLEETSSQWHPADGLERGFSDLKQQLTSAAATGDQSAYASILLDLRTSDWNRLLDLTKTALDPSVGIPQLLEHVASYLGFEHVADMRDWNERLLARILQLLQAWHPEQQLRRDLGLHRARLQELADAGDFDAYSQALRLLLKPPFRYLLGLEDQDFKPTLLNKVDLVGRYVTSEIELSHQTYRRKLTVAWGSLDVKKAFVALPLADSITLDPHKMAYLPYPCGLVAFKNDRVRHFILQQAPYISAAKQNVLVHTPPRYLPKESPGSGSTTGRPRRPVIEAFGPFILEGSRPGASAAALWLTLKTVPLTMGHHGAIARASLLAARELYEWLSQWENVMKHLKIDVDYRLVPLTPEPPDTNVVTFVVKSRGSNSLADMNEVTRRVYNRFSIQAELGDRQYSYAHPFFLSNTTCAAPSYPLSCLESFFLRSEIQDAHTDYPTDKLIVLRATVMNPYIHSMSSLGVQYVMKEFLEELTRAAADAVKVP